MILILWFPWICLWLGTFAPAIAILVILIGYWKRERRLQAGQPEPSEGS